MIANTLKPLVALLALMHAMPVLAALPNGVASGDISQDSAWLWARSDTSGMVKFEVSTNAGFTSIASTFNAIVNEPMQPVKGMVSGLNAGQQYYYRATDSTNASLSGSFRTAATVGTHNGLRFGVSGDWRGELAPYPAIKNVAESKLDFFVKHGDTIYAERYSGPQVGQVAITLPEYRDRQRSVIQPLRHEHLAGRARQHANLRQH